MRFIQNNVRESSCTTEENVRDDLFGLLPRRKFLALLAAPTALSLLPVGPFGKAAAAPLPLLGSRPASLFGYYSGHLQGFCTDGRGSIYWSMTTTLVKTDATGTVANSISVPNHHGDPCYLDGKIYVAVNLGLFNDAQQRANSWIYVYDAETLALISKHMVSEIIYGAGGITYCDGKFLVVGGLPVGFNENYLYEYDRDLKLIREIRLQSGYTFLGIQTAAYNADHWWFGCYGYPEMMLKVSKDFRTIQKFSFDCSLGIEAVDENIFLVAQGVCSRSQGCTAELSPQPLDKWIAKGVLKPLDDRTVGVIPPWRKDLLEQSSRSSPSWP